MPALIAPQPPRLDYHRPEPTFSVIIAAYQAAFFIADAIESALGQTTPPHEIVVCDDGSTDELEDALAPYANRIVFVRQENRGEGAAKNTAARQASGEFLVFLDADDVYLPGRLEALGEAARLRPDLEILVTDAHIEVEGRAVRRAYDDSWPFEVDDQRRGILERNFILGHAAVARDRFFAVGGFDDSMRIVADWDLWIRVLLAGARAGLVPEPLSCYRVREGSLSTQRTRILAGGIRCLERAAARDDLSVEERVVVRRSLATWRCNLVVAQAYDALLHGGPDVRQRMFPIVVGRGYGAKTRLKAAASFLLPGRAGRTLARREQASFVGAAGIRVDQKLSDSTAAPGPGSAFGEVDPDGLVDDGPSLEKPP